MNDRNVYDHAWNVEHIVNLDVFLYPNDTDCFYASNVDKWFTRDTYLTIDSEGNYFYTEPDYSRIIRPYHRSPEPQYYVKSEWGIGFEVEKTHIVYRGKDRRYSDEPVQKQPLFCGWETDSSCGIEGITHVYDLLRDEKKFLAHVKQSGNLNANVNRDCGGHVNISGPGEKFKMRSIRQYAGLLYAVYRKRLNIEYAMYNKGLEEASDDHYSCIRFRRRGFYEFRLIAAVKNSDQLIWRYFFFRQLALAIQESITFDEYLESCESLLLDVYSKAKKNDILRYAKHFNAYLQEGEIDSRISEYI